MIDFSYADYAWEQAVAVLAIDSPSGFTGKAAAWVKSAFEQLGFEAKITTKKDEIEKTKAAAESIATVISALKGRL